VNATERSSFRALLIAVFVSSIPATLILPMMPSLGAAFDIGATELGLLVGIYPLTSMVVSPFWGRMSDRYGRKPVLLATLLGGAIAFTVFALSTSWLGLLAGRAMQGLAGTPRGIGFAVASDISDEENLSGRMGSVTASMAAAFTIGPIIGGLFMGEDPNSWLGQLRTLIGLPGAGFNHVLPSLIGIFVNLAAMGLIATGFRESWHPEAAERVERAPDSRRRSFSSAILQASVIVTILFFLLSGFIQGSLQFSFALWADLTRGWTAQYIAWSGAMIGLGFAVGSGVLLKPLTRRIGPERTVLTGTLIDATGLCAFLLLQQNTVLALGALFVSTLGGAFWATTILTLLSREIDERDQGLALGFANGATLLGRVIGPAFAGYLAANVAAGAPFGFMLLCVALAIVRGILLVRDHRRQLAAASA
jgi:MFS family permease